MVLTTFGTSFEPAKPMGKITGRSLTPKALGAFFIALLIAVPAGATSQCRPAVESVSEVHSRFFNNVLVVIKGGFAAVPSREHWLSKPRRAPVTQFIVDNLIQLSPDERETIRQRISETPPKNSELSTIFDLALYNQEAWFKLFSQAVSRPFADDRIAGSLVPLLRAMPDDLTDKLLDLIPSVHLEVSTSLSGRRNFTLFPPRKEVRLAP